MAESRNPPRFTKITAYLPFFDQIKQIRDLPSKTQFLEVKRLFLSESPLFILRAKGIRNQLELRDSDDSDDPNSFIRNIYDAVIIDLIQTSPEWKPYLQDAFVSLIECVSLDEGYNTDSLTKENIDFLEKYIALGADVNTPSSISNTYPLFVATRELTMKFLFQHGANPNLIVELEYTDRTIGQRVKSTFTRLLQITDEIAKFGCAYGDDLSIVAMLIEAGSELDFQGSYNGNTALHLLYLSYLNNQTDNEDFFYVIGLLHYAGARTDLENKDGMIVRGTPEYYQQEYARRSGRLTELKINKNDTRSQQKKNAIQATIHAEEMRIADKIREILAENGEEHNQKRITDNDPIANEIRQMIQEKDLFYRIMRIDDEFEEKITMDDYFDQVLTVAGEELAYPIFRNDRNSNSNHYSNRNNNYYSNRNHSSYTNNGNEKSNNNATNSVVAKGGRRTRCHENKNNENNEKRNALHTAARGGRRTRRHRHPTKLHRRKKTQRIRRRPCA